MQRGDAERTLLRRDERTLRELQGCPDERGRLLGPETASVRADVSGISTYALGKGIVRVRGVRRWLFLGLGSMRSVSGRKAAMGPRASQVR